MAILMGGLYFFGFIGDPVSRCCNRMGEIATACEMYATDNAGRYPKSMELLAPRYLKGGVPKCPLGGGAYNFESKIMPDLYSLQCRGTHYQRAGFRPGYPYFAADGGWCMAPGNYPSMPPDKYLELFHPPSL